MRTKMRAILVVVMLAVASGLLLAQATHVSTSGTLPASCRVGDVYYKTGTSAGLYSCTASNTWTLATSGGGGSSVSRGTFASLPAASTAGNIYFFTDSGYDYAYDTGSAWEYYRDGRRMYDPTLQTFSWVNQGSASLSTTTGGITMTTGAGSISDNHRMQVKAAPATPYTITIAFIADYWSADYYIYGAYWRNSGAGTLAMWSYNGKAFSFSAQNRLYEFVKFNSPTSFNSSAAVQFANKYIGDEALHWLRFSDDGTNRKVYASHDGVAWVEMFSEGRTTFLTADQVGWGLNQYTSARGYSMTLLSWQES